ncbi:unnamed protein product [Clonostachys rhizophaga]|uniref:Zn(2)-C6 fungal-type domain-containing protein n=1 Tax=Clonostachys rhizophaga TaxID=160324 RepID=A0A9N9VSC8_9HYPO|nr:unnamed protein product [Clonostachys rhizophaga]
MPVSSGRRMPLSCEPCRERKIKCPRNDNRGKDPCETCVRRGIPSSECVYLRDQWSRRRAPAGFPSSENAQLVARIDRLEEMLRQSVSSTARQPPLEPDSNLPSPESTLPHSSGSLSGRNDTWTVGNLLSSRVPPAGVIVRFESGHERFEPSSSRWSSNLQDNPKMGGIKTNIEGGDGGPFPFSPSRTDITELLGLLPPTSYCDELKSTFFAVFAPLLHILHDPTFETDYRLFQSDPEKVSLSWLALLFVIMSIAVTALPEDSPLLHQLGHRNSPLENTSQLNNRYRSAAMRCLDADHYLWRHNLHTLQALVLLVYGINHTHGQSWALLGTARNIALALGCHVDPTVFQMDRIRVEERRRCWAGLNMLYTIQNTTLGNLDSTPTPSSANPPLDVNDDELVAGIEIHASRGGPTQMSYLLLKFDLYRLCNRICSETFGSPHPPSYNQILDLNSEISAFQEMLNCKYLFSSTQPMYHAAHLNILFGYSHQLVLLLHRPILQARAQGRYSEQNVLSSRGQCIESSKALLGIHRTLHEDQAFKPYRWYNRGLGSFHAFHAAVCLAHIYISFDLDAAAACPLYCDVQDCLEIFEQVAKSGMSPICRKAIPILKKLLNIMGTPAGNVDKFTVTEIQRGQDLGFDGNSQRAMGDSLESLGPQQWLSPSTMDWDDWESFLGTNSLVNT